MSEHHCEKLPEGMSIERTADHAEWRLVNPTSWYVLAIIRYCPFCGKNLKGTLTKEEGM